MIYYIADMHFVHKNILKYDKRPFADTEQMDEKIIRRWNGRVNEYDTVYVLDGEEYESDGLSEANHCLDNFNVAVKIAEMIGSGEPK